MAKGRTDWTQGVRSDAGRTGPKQPFTRRWQVITMHASVLETAQKFYNLGIATIPVRFGDKRPAIGSWSEYQTRLPAPSELISWFLDRKNIGIVTGWRGLTVIDFDSNEVGKKCYDKWVSWASRNRSSKAAQTAKAAYRVSTSRGVHVYVYLTTPERNRHLDGIDIKAAGGYVLGEGSVHPTGAIYEALTPTMIIPTVDNLSDILPAALLLKQEMPATIQPPTFSAPGSPILSTDPWTVASNPSTAISTGLVDKIRSTLPIESFFPSATPTSADSRWLMTQCPLHDDHNPSFWLDTERQICGCYAGCTSRPLDVINLYARLYGLSNRDAIMMLAKLMG